MVYLILIFIPLALLVGLFVLTGYETRNEVRLFGSRRAQFDAHIERTEFIITHVDFSAFLKELVGNTAKRVVHDVVHFSLLAVRAVERFLTRMVRHLRADRAGMVAPRETTREFVQTLSDFKDQLKETPPEIPDIL